MTGKISEMAAASTLSGTELVPLVQGGANVNATAQAIANLAGGSLGSAVTALTIASGVVNIDCSLGDYFTLALTANVTSITFSNLPASGKARTLMARLKQDATGGRTVAMPSSFKAITGSDTAVQSVANAYTVLALSTLDQGTRWEYSMKAGAA